MNTYNINEIVPTIRLAPPGKKIIYHEGFLFADRSRPKSSDWEDAAVVRELANAVYDMALAGEVFLVQKKIGEHEFLYVAIKASEDYKKSYGFLQWKEYRDKKTEATRPYIRKAVTQYPKPVGRPRAEVRV